MNEQALDYKMQGFAMMGVEKFDKAVELFSKSIEIEQNSDVYMDLGNAYASMGEYDNAVDAFSKALLLDPNNGEILFDIGCVYLLQERLKKCIEYYNKAEAAGYDNVRLYMNMAAIYNALKDKQMELRCYTKAIDKDPMMGELYVKKVMLFVDLQRYAEALETLDDMRKLFPDAFEGYDLAARIYSGQGHADEAIKILEEGLKKFPKDINLRISLITQYLDVNRVEDAENVIAELKKHEYADTFEKAILMQEVSVAATKNQPEIMFDLLSRVVKLEQEGECDEQARFMLMMTSILLKKYEVALEMAEVLERQNSKNSFSISGLYYKAEILENLGKHDEAEAQFKKASRELRVISMSNRTFYECYLFRALAHKNLKEYDKALEMGEYIINLREESPDGYMTMADIYKAMGNTEKSDEYFEIAESKK